MGTSQSHNLKTEPQWAAAKRTLTNIVNQRGNLTGNYKNFMRRFGSAINDGMYRGTQSGSSFGQAGGRVIRNFVSFIIDSQKEGLEKTLRLDLIPEDKHPDTKEKFIETVLMHLAGEHTSTMDDAASIDAMEKILYNIVEGCETADEVKDKLLNADMDEMRQWIIDFEIEYILEYSGEIFQSHIFNKCENPETVIDQIRMWLHTELDERMANDLSKHNLATPEGKEMLDILTSEILDIWTLE